MYAKKHEANGRNIVAICDENILGKKFEDGDVCLEVKRDFYNGNLINADEALKLMEDGDILNLCGEECINLAIKNSIINKNNILRINGVPHAQCF